jgi:hypothetical protein
MQCTKYLGTQKASCTLAWQGEKNEKSKDPGQAEHEHLSATHNLALIQKSKIEMRKIWKDLTTKTNPKT